MFIEAIIPPISDLLKSFFIECGVSFGSKLIFDKISQNKDRIGNELLEILKKSFDNSIKFFFDEKVSPYMITKEIYEKLVSLSKEEIALVFHKIEYHNLVEKSQNIYFLFAEDLKKYNQIKGIILPDEFYEFWNLKFKEEFKNSFFEYLKRNENFKLRLFVEILETSIEKIDEILKNQEIILSRIDSGFEFQNKRNESVSTTIISKLDAIQSAVEKQSIELPDKEIEKIENLYNKGEYSECKTYIELVKDDKINNLPKEIKSIVYNILGNCFLYLGNKKTAIEKYILAKEIDENNDRPKYNLAQRALEDRNENDFLLYLDEFKDKESYLYRKLYFEYLNDYKADYEKADEYLETNKSFFPNYLYYKAIILINKNPANQSDGEQLLEQYINETDNNESKIAAKFSLYTNKFVRKLNDLTINIRHYFNFDGELEIVQNPKLKENKDVQLLLENFSLLYDELKKFPFDHKCLVLKTLIIKKLLEYVLGQLSTSEILIDEINSKYENLKIDNLSNIILIWLNLICKRFDKAEFYFNVLDEEDKEENIKIYLTILFGKKQYKKILELIEIKKLNSLFFEHLKLISSICENGWDKTFLYIKNQKYNEPDKLLMSAELASSNSDYDYAANIFIKLSSLFLQERMSFDLCFIEQLIYDMKKLSNDNKINEIRNNLIEFSWNKDSSINNFNVGILYAINLCNEKQFSACLENLEILSKYCPDDINIKNLYAYIDSVNLNPNTLIRNYESNSKVKNESLFPYVAKAYIDKGKYNKAKKVIDSLKYIDGQKLNYYYLYLELYMKQKNEKEFIKIAESALSEFPQELQINHFLFSQILKFKTSNEKTRNIFVKSMSCLKNNKVISEFKIDYNKDSKSQLQEFLDKIHPYEQYKKEEENHRITFDLYEKRKLSIKWLANNLNTNEASLFATFINDYKQNIYSNLDIQVENELYMKKLKKNKPIILSPSSLILIKAMDIENLIFENFDIRITAITKSELEKIVNDINPPTIQRLIRDINGEPVLITVDNHIVKYIEYIKYCIENIKIINFKSNSSKANSIIKLSETIPVENILQDSIVAKQNNCYICSSDLLSQKVNKCFSLFDISIYTILLYLKENNIISEAEFLDIKYKLISIKYKYLSISIKEIFAFIIDEKKSFEILLDYFDKQYTKDSLSNVLALFVEYQTQNENIYEYINLIFSKFKKLDLSNEIVKLFMNRINKIFYQFTDNIQRTFLYNLAEISRLQDENLGFLVDIIEQINLIEFDDIKQYELKRLINNSDIRIRESLKNHINKIQT